MSTEEPKEEEAAAAPAATETTAGEGTPANGGDNKGKRGPRKPREDQVPIEELFDLTQPIPRADKPNKEEHDKAMDELSEAVKALQEKRKEVQEKIDTAMDDPVTKAELQEKRAELNEFKRKKTALIEEKRTVRGELDKVKNENEKIMKDKKDARSNVRFNSVDEINKEIAKLEKRQETTSMSLQEEKRLIKEIDSLQASKKFVTDIKSKDAAIDDIKAQRKSLSEQLSSKDKEIDKLTADIDTVMEAIKAINEKEAAKRETKQELFAEREELRKQIGEKIKEKDARRDEFREKNDAFYNYQRAIRAQKKMKYEEEKAKREAERAEYEAKLAAEEEKKIPYEEEQALCEFLAGYLERTYLGVTQTTASTKKSEFVAVKDDPFAGFKPVSKKDEQEEFFSKGKSGKKKRTRKEPKKQDPADGPFTLSVDTFEQFGMIQLDPPTKLAEVEKSVKELREKKEWYKQQPRGSVPTAQEIRKSNEKKAARQSSARSEENGAATNGKKDTKKFALDNDEFVPLGAADDAPKVNSSWGQKPPAAAVESAAAEEIPAADGL